MKPNPKPNPLIGHNVLWYPRADKEGDCRAALVTGPAEVHRENVLSLTVFGENAVTPRTFTTVRHVDDPKLETHPRMREVGGWDYLKSRHGKTLGRPPRTTDEAGRS